MNNAETDELIKLRKPELVRLYQKLEKEKEYSERERLNFLSKANASERRVVELMRHISMVSETSAGIKAIIRSFLIADFDFDITMHMPGEKAKITIDQERFRLLNHLHRLTDSIAQTLNATKQSGTSMDAFERGKK